MGNCLVTKLNGAIEDTSMLRIGEMRVHFSKVDNPTNAMHQLVVVGTKEGVLGIIGNGHFTDETLTQNLGKTAKVRTWQETLYVSEEVREVAILDKYSIKSFLSSYPTQDSNPNKSFDFSAFNKVIFFEKPVGGFPCDAMQDCFYSVVEIKNQTLPTVEREELLKVFALLKSDM